MPLAFSRGQQGIRRPSHKGRGDCCTNRRRVPLSRPWPRGVAGYVPLRSPLASVSLLLGGGVSMGPLLCQTCPAVWSLSGSPPPRPGIDKANTLQQPRNHTRHLVYTPQNSTPPHVHPSKLHATPCTPLETPRYACPGEWGTAPMFTLRLPAVWHGQGGRTAAALWQPRHASPSSPGSLLPWRGRYHTGPPSDSRWARPLLETLRCRGWPAVHGSCPCADRSETGCPRAPAGSGRLEKASQIAHRPPLAGAALAARVHPAPVAAPRLTRRAGQAEDGGHTRR